MATLITIKQQIKKTVDGKYSDWQIGVTNDPKHRKAQLGNPLSWLQWKVDTEETAFMGAQYFQKKGMLCDGELPKSAKYIYILLVHSFDNNIVFY